MQSTKPTHAFLTPFFGLNEKQFLEIFSHFGPVGHVTIRKRCASVPLKQPPTFESAWGSGRKRELQVVLRPGRAMENFCKFQDFNRPGQRERFFFGHGYKQINVKIVSEIAAIFTVDSRKRPGRQTKLTIYTSTCFVTHGYQIKWSNCGYETTHDIDVGAECATNILDYYDRMLKCASSRAASESSGGVGIIGSDDD